MFCKFVQEMYPLFPKTNLDFKVLLIVLEVIGYAIATGTKGTTGNQWNPDQTFPQQQWPQTKGAPLGGWDDEVSNPQGRFPNQGPMWKLEDAIPGVPGQSYPNFKKIPYTSFDCRSQIGPGYYADLEAKCQVFHICQADGRHNSFLCPIGTMFNQLSFTCDWWFNVICSEATTHYTRNDNLYKSPYIGIDGLKVSGYSDQRPSHKTRNVQQSPVGIPKAQTGSKGANWNQQNPSQSNWMDNRRGSQKGDDTPMGKKGMHKQRNWPNKRSGNANMWQNGPRRNIQGQQRGQPNQKSFNLPNTMGVMHQSWDQRGERIPNTQMFNQQGGVKRRRQPNVGNQSKGQKRRNPNARQMGQNRNMNSNKGFDTNTWSIRAQNFQIRSQDRKSSSSEVIRLNNNDAHEENYTPQKGTGSDNDESFFSNSSDYDNNDVYNEWNYSAENSNQWQENVEGNYQTQWSNSYDEDYDYS